MNNYMKIIGFRKYCDVDKSLPLKRISTVFIVELC